MSEIPFPPQAERNRLLQQAEVVLGEATEELKKATPEQIHFYELFNTRMTELIQQGREDAVDQIVDGSHAIAFIQQCNKLGKELFGELWSEQYGMALMTSLALDITYGTRCSGCILGHHEPHLHVVENDETKPET